MLDGIATSISVQSFPAPPSATIFPFDWEFFLADELQLANALDIYQKIRTGY